MPRKTLSRSSRFAFDQPCFNEAAARCRGKRTPAACSCGLASASMRPRPDAAENLRSGRHAAELGRLQ